MKTKEKLEKSRWRFDGRLGYHYEIYARGMERVIYDPHNDKVVAFYHQFDGGMHAISDEEFNFLTKTE